MGYFLTSSYSNMTLNNQRKVPSLNLIEERTSASEAEAQTYWLPPAFGSQEPPSMQHTMAPQPQMQPQMQPQIQPQMQPQTQQITPMQPQGTQFPQLVHPMASNVIPGAMMPGAMVPSFLQTGTREGVSASEAEAQTYWLPPAFGAQQPPQASAPPMQQMQQPVMQQPMMTASQHPMQPMQQPMYPMMVNQPMGSAQPMGAFLQTGT